MVFVVRTSGAEDFSIMYPVKGSLFMSEAASIKWSKAKGTVQ